MDNVTVVTESTDYDSVNRNTVMDLIVKGLEGPLVRGWIERDNDGPMGGKSSRLYGVVEVNGIMVPVAINVYSDVNIEAVIKRMINEDKRSDRIRKALESNGREIPSPTGVLEGDYEFYEGMNVPTLRRILDEKGYTDPTAGYIRKDDLLGIVEDNI